MPVSSLRSVVILAGVAAVVGFSPPLFAQPAEQKADQQKAGETKKTESARQADAIAEAARTEMDEAVEFGLASPFPAPERATDYVYA